MSSPVPLHVQHFLSALKGKGYALSDSSAPKADREALQWMLWELSPDLPGGQVWVLRMSGEWHVGIAFAGVVRSPLEVADVIAGAARGPDRGVPRIEAEGQATLRVLDRLHGDRDVAARVSACLGPAPDDPALEGHDNDPCWCGSGKKIKRCHKTLRP